jgi:hypothetical protein
VLRGPVPGDAYTASGAGAQVHDHMAVLHFVHLHQRGARNVTAVSSRLSSPPPDRKNLQIARLRGGAGRTRTNNQTG